MLEALPNGPRVVIYSKNPATRSDIQLVVGTKATAATANVILGPTGIIETTVKREGFVEANPEDVNDAVVAYATENNLQLTDVWVEQYLADSAIVIQALVSPQDSSASSSSSFR